VMGRVEQALRENNLAPYVMQPRHNETAVMR
jgi:hypothetical protein